jgi:hypothetical protein
MVAAVSAVVTLGLAVWAQEGHPLSGTWHGEWVSGARKTPVVLYMQWQSRRITGVINPGPNSMPLTVATLSPGDWAVHLEAEMRDQRGNATPIVIDGKIDEIGSYNRTITGTWTQGATKGEFKARRD